MIQTLVLCCVLVTGGSVLPRAVAQSDVVGQWSGVISWPIVTIHSHLLPNGKVLLWPRDGGNQARVWDPVNNTFVNVPLGMNLFCSGHAFMADGRLYVAGGHIQDGIGEKLTHLFDYRNNSWTRVADMNAGRWYPTATTLANGDLLAISGDTTRRNNDIPQVYQVATGTYRTLSGAKLALPLYPFMHLAPNGKVFNSGPNTTTRYLDTSGSGSWTTVATRSVNRSYGSAIQYDNGKIVLIGGGDPPVASAEVIDLTQATPSWRAAGSMAQPRRQLNTTLLPDGTIFVSGGSSAGGFNNACGAVFAGEIWNPATETFSTMASAKEVRVYHSTALLLTDGRVLTGGGGQPASGDCSDADHYTVEFYSPPYLFKGARPAITSAPTSVGYGQTFFVETPDATAITKVNWVRLGSVTHAFDMNQRINRLAFSQATGGLNVTAPTSASLCPPGDYMLFILNGTGVPSVAKIMRIN